jgi:predicted DCC family thiol-disulfide oxidoreductase YuxK
MESDNDKINDIVFEAINGSGSIILFDSKCNLCDEFVNFVIDRDPNKIFTFASIQSIIGKAFLDYFNLSHELSTVYLIEDQKYYVKTEASLRIFSKLGCLWSSLYYLSWPIPIMIRDFCYDFIYKRRYDIFGQNNNCRILTPDLKSRFLDL